MKFYTPHYKNISHLKSEKVLCPWYRPFSGFFCPLLPLQLGAGKGLLVQNMWTRFYTFISNAKYCHTEPLERKRNAPMWQKSIMWNLRREIQQRRQYLLIIVLGCLIMTIGVIISLSFLRFSASSSRFLGPILTFVGFTAILFGVRWRKNILMAEHQLQQQQQGLTGGLTMAEPQPAAGLPFNHDGDPRVPLQSHGGMQAEQNKYLVAPAYSAPGFPAPYPAEPPPPYEPPTYDNATTSLQSHATGAVPSVVGWSVWGLWVDVLMSWCCVLCVVLLCMSHCIELLYLLYHIGPPSRKRSYKITPVFIY